MNLTVVGEGLTDEQVDAMQAGLSSMDAADAAVIVTDTFVETVRGRTGQQAYTTGRGASVVGARTVHVDGESTIIVNAPETRNCTASVFERLLAHEAGHTLLNQRQETLERRRHLALAEWEWWLLCLGALALDEARIERALAELGYPASDTGAIAHVEDGLLHLNAEVLKALLDPASSDVVTLAQSIMRTHDWLSKQLAYVAAYRSDLSPPGLAGLSVDARANWDDYIAPVWESRIALYDSAPTALMPVSSTDLDELIQQAKRQEVAQLAKIGFRYATVGRGFSFRRIASDTLCNARTQRAIKEIDRREGSQKQPG